VNGWRIHDVRRTVASGMARIGVDPHVIEKVLNHKSGIISGVAAVYNRYAYEKEKRSALNRWAEHVADVSADGSICTGQADRVVC
jgi:integrase